MWPRICVVFNDIWWITICVRVATKSQSQIVCYGISRGISSTPVTNHFNDPINNTEKFQCVMWKELKDERAAAAATADSWHCGTLAGPHYAMTWHMNVFTLCRPLLHRPSIVSLTNSYIQRDVGDVAAHQSAGYNHVYATLPFCWCPCISKHRNGGGICVFSVLHQRYTTYVRTTRIYSIYIMCTTGNLMTIISHVPLNGTISNKSGFICFFFFLFHVHSLIFFWCVVCLCCCVCFICFDARFLFHIHSRTNILRLLWNLCFH